MFSRYAHFLLSTVQNLCIVQEAQTLSVSTSLRNLWAVMVSRKLGPSIKPLVTSVVANNATPRPVLEATLEFKVLGLSFTAALIGKY